MSDDLYHTHRAMTYSQSVELEGHFLLNWNGSSYRFLPQASFPIDHNAYAHLQSRICNSVQTPQQTKWKPKKQKAKISKTINSRDSLVVTHPTTSLPAQFFRTAERTGSPILIVLWSIATVISGRTVHMWVMNEETRRQMQAREDLLPGWENQAEWG
jgi:hypothetical protein